MFDFILLLIIDILDEKTLGFKPEKAPLYQGLTKEEEELIDAYKITADDITYVH